MCIRDRYIIEQRRGVVEIIISSNTSKPIYEQITSQIKAMIMSGELKTGDPIPVSYTHLDVYKRQVLYILPFGRLF